MSKNIVTDDTYVLPQIYDLDRLFMETDNAKTINEAIIGRSSEELVELLCDISGDDNEMVARCECENLKGNVFENKICPKCGDVCSIAFEKIVKNDLWVEIPDSIPKILDPQVYRILASWLGSINKVPVMDIILNRKEEVPPVLEGIVLDQGFKFFYENFDALMAFFFTQFRSSKHKSTGMMAIFLELNKDKIWCTKLPIISKYLQPITGMGDKKVDSAIKLMMKAITDFRSTLIDDKLQRAALPRVEKNFFNVYKSFTDYSAKIVKERLSPKKALLRKHVFGNRLHLTGRTVCVPIIDEHYGDELYLPWVLGIQLWFYHILSILQDRYHFTRNQAYNKLSHAVTVYDFQVDKCMQTLIRESPYKGLPILLNRNPSLKLGAIQLLFVTKINPNLKRDPKVEVGIDELDDVSFMNSETAKGRKKYIIPDWVQHLIADKVIGCSAIIIAAPNCDFDGDELNLIPIMELAAVEKFMAIHPSARVLSNKAVEIEGGDITLSNQTYIGLTDWVNEPIPMDQ